MEEWADWQRHYIHGLFVIWPPDPVRQRVNRLRQACDPSSQATIEAHITLTQPFLARPDDESWARLAQIGASFTPIEIAYGPVATFFPNPVIYLSIEPREKILALRQALHETGLFNLGLPYTDNFIPHMTISEGLSEKKADASLLAEVQAEAPAGTFLVEEIAYVRPDDGFHFELIRWVRLASG